MRQARAGVGSALGGMFAPVLFLRGFLRCACVRYQFVRTLFSVQYRETQYLNSGIVGANLDDTASTTSKFVPKRRKRQRLFGTTMKSEILV